MKALVLCTVLCCTAAMSALAAAPHDTATNWHNPPNIWMPDSYKLRCSILHIIRKRELLHTAEAEEQEALIAEVQAKVVVIEAEVAAGTNIQTELQKWRSIYQDQLAVLKKIKRERNKYLVALNHFIHYFYEYCN